MINNEITKFRKDNPTKKVPVDAQSIGIGDGNVFEESSESESEHEEPEEKVEDDDDDYEETPDPVYDPPISTVDGKFLKTLMSDD